MSTWVVTCLVCSKYEYENENNIFYAGNPDRSWPAYSHGFIFNKINY